MKFSVITDQYERPRCKVIEMIKLSLKKLMSKFSTLILLADPHSIISTLIHLIALDTFSCNICRWH